MYKTQIIDLQEKFEMGIEKAAQLILRGEVVAFPTETVYGLGANALKPEAVSMIYAAKGRPGDNPLIVHISNRKQAFGLAHVTQEAEMLMDAFWPGPLTIVLSKRENVPYEVTAGLQTVAIRMPDHDAALALIDRCGVPIAAPSANRSGRPSPTTAQHVLEDFDRKIPLILDGGETVLGVESTVIAFDPRPVILRPGCITAEMIAEVLGEVELGPYLLSPAKASQTVQSPGVKYRHYAPKAHATVVCGEVAQIVQKTNEAYKMYEIQQKKCIILCSIQTSIFYAEKNCAIMGDRNSPTDFCQNLYKALRDADHLDVDEILIESLPTSDQGLAYMNRALRAASFETI